VEALGKDLFVVGKVPGLPALLHLRLASPRPLLLPMPALVEARDGGAGGTGGAEGIPRLRHLRGRHGVVLTPTRAVESYNADLGYFHEGYPTARLHPMQLLLPTPTRGISTTPQKVSASCSRNGVVGDWIPCWMMDVFRCFDCVLCFFIFSVYVWI